MPKRAAATATLMVSLDEEAPTPLYRQLYAAVRNAVLSGMLAPGSRLPASRTLADDLGISRNTVSIAFEQLLAEGYVEGKVGAGTYVCRSLPDHHSQIQATAAPLAASAQGNRRLSKRGAAYVANSEQRYWTGASPEPFFLWHPAQDSFPFKHWARLVGRHWRESPSRFLGFGEPAGFRPLREAIAAYVKSARGLRCTAEQVLITSNVDRACHLVSLVLLDDCDTAWIEDPGYLVARPDLLGGGTRSIPVPIDAEGLDVAQGMRCGPKSRLACVLPSLHYPLAVTMSLQRRLALLDWASQSDSWILEIDYGCEFRFRGRPLAALQGLDRHHRVIYYGSFRQMMFPGLALSYLVVPRDLADSFAAALVTVDSQAISVYQAAMADFINEGHFARHVRRMRRLYAEKQAAFLKAVSQHLAGLLDVQPSDGGFHLVGWLPPGVDDVAAADAAARHGVNVTPLSRCAVGKLQRGALLMGYGALSIRQIWSGTSQLATALRTIKRTSRKRT